MQEDPPRHMTEGVVANLSSLYELLGDKYVRRLCLCLCLCIHTHGYAHATTSRVSPTPLTHQSYTCRAYREERMRVLESVARRFRLDDVEARFFL